MCAAHHETNGKRCNAHTNKRKNARKLTSVEKRMAEGKTSKIYVFFPWKGEKKDRRKNIEPSQMKAILFGQTSKNHTCDGIFPEHTQNSGWERENAEFISSSPHTSCIHMWHLSLAKHTQRIGRWKNSMKIGDAHREQTAHTEFETIWEISPFVRLYTAYVCVSAGLSCAANNFWCQNLVKYVCN